jgi:hypothetical protein
LRRNLGKLGLIIAFVVATIMTLTGGAAFAVVGGQDATHPGSHAAVWIDGSYRCTGSVVSDRSWVLTSGDCAALAQTAPTQVVVGTTSLGQCALSQKGCEQVDVVAASFDPNYTGETPAYDVGLLKLARPVHVRPAWIDAAADRVGTQGIAAGWGYTCQDPAVPTCNTPAATLQELRLSMVDASRCDLGTLPSGAPVVDPNLVACVAASDGSKAMLCIGDSGAILLGTINVGDGDDLEPRPDYCSTSPSGGQGTGLATRIGPSLRWIVRTICQGDVVAAGRIPIKTLSPEPRWQQTVLVG